MDGRNREAATMKTRNTIKMALTPEQQTHVERLTGQNVPTVKLALEEVEARVTPALISN
jgi:hypothetical protein